MTDRVIEGLRANSINKGNISFDLIRNFAGIDLNLWDRLGRGRAILNSEEELDQYLYTYGPMISSQWRIILYELGNLNLPRTDIEISDYACGQGLACLLLHDVLPDSALGNITKVNLIEPSSVALTRAVGITECCFPNASINPIKKHLDCLDRDDLNLSEGPFKIHLFSNILDMEGFNQYLLLEKILKTPGTHLIMVASHDRNHNGGSQRIRETYQTMIDKTYAEWYEVTGNSISYFNCYNRQPAIFFHVELKI
ncbi:hypothetical protein [Halioxenophilus aromaticivorans]|uniref:Methyltransferase domain-containing protein n=1 Tax=Halioxenophilus aromaticivorans TaxID=1306992 RepID=A0AAV3U5B9_9ALTE